MKKSKQFRNTHNRLEYTMGALEAVQRMIKSDKPMSEIIRQLNITKGIFDSIVNGEFRSDMKEELRRRLDEIIQSGKFDAVHCEVFVDIKSQVKYMNQDKLIRWMKKTNILYYRIAPLESLL